MANRTKIITTTKLLPCKLTRDEHEERSRQLVEAMSELDGHAEHELNVKSQLKARRAEIESKIAELHGVCRSKSEPRQVPVEIFADFSAGIAYEQRQDTYEETSRPLTDAERAKAQLQIDG